MRSTTSNNTTYAMRFTSSSPSTRCSQRRWSDGKDEDRLKSFLLLHVRPPLAFVWALASTFGVRFAVPLSSNLLDESLLRQTPNHRRDMTPIVALCVCCDGRFSPQLQRCVHTRLAVGWSLRLRSRDAPRKRRRLLTGLCSGVALPLELELGFERENRRANE